MWTDAPAAQLVPALAEIAHTLPPAPSHVMMLLWGPPQPVPDMAFSMQANVYLGLYGVATDASYDGACRDWATGHMRRLEPLSRGIQLADENLGLRSAPFASGANMRRIDELRQRLDPTKCSTTTSGVLALAKASRSMRHRRCRHNGLAAFNGPIHGLVADSQIAVF
jgi:hypothetical protein